MILSGRYFLQKLVGYTMFAANLALPINSGLAAAADRCHKSVEYVALGDSVAFGDNGYIPKTAAARPDQSVFVGYPELLAQALYNDRLVNLSCPGETSGSLISQDSVAPVCRDYRSQVGLKVDYEGTQLDALLALVRANPDIKLITLSIGGNDFFQVQNQCIAENPSDPTAINACLQARVPGAIYGLYLNVQALWQQVKTAGFKGKLIYVNNYSLNFQDPLRTQIAYSANAMMQSTAEVEEAIIADVFSVFASKVQPFGGDNCKTDLFLMNPIQPAPAGESTCDFHTSSEGSKLIAKIVEAVAK